VSISELLAQGSGNAFCQAVRNAICSFSKASFVNPMQALISSGSASTAQVVGTKVYQATAFPRASINASVDLEQADTAAERNAQNSASIGQSAIRSPDTPTCESRLGQSGLSFLEVALTHIRMDS